MNLSRKNYQLAIAHIIDNLVRKYDDKVEAEYTTIMKVDNAIRYNEKVVFKYGLSLTENHVSFHSMVMYANGFIMELSKKYLPNAHFNKGCINFKDWSTFDPEGFGLIIRHSAEADFTPVLSEIP